VPQPELAVLPQLTISARPEPLCAVDLLKFCYFGAARAALRRRSSEILVSAKILPHRCEVGVGTCDAALSPGERGLSFEALLFCCCATATAVRIVWPFTTI
jgi:hypothetical protein